jgi:hypothetical protein
MSQIWREVPVGPDAHRWVTRPGTRAVLVVVHTVTTGQRLLDVVRLLEPDLRIQSVFTVAPDVFSDGADDFLRGLHPVIIPWAQAIRLPWDLVLAAAYGGLHELHGPVVVVPHGAGYSKLAGRPAAGRPAARSVYGLEAQRLVRDGRVVPAAIVVPHEADLTVLARQCPPARPVATVAGDPSYDRVVASLPYRASYRRALGVGHGQTLVVAASTWGRYSLFGQDPELPARLARELPAGDHRVVVLLHPNVWFGHGIRQVRAWLSGCGRHVLDLLPPAADWRGVLAAADVLVGDLGSSAVYAAVAPVPILLAAAERSEVHPDSPGGLLAATAPRLRPRQSLPRQLRQAAACYEPGRYAPVAARITSQPGRFSLNMRRLLYGLLRLPPPVAAPTAAPPAELPFLYPGSTFPRRDAWPARSW